MAADVGSPGSAATSSAAAGRPTTSANQAGIQGFNHSLVGELTLGYEALALLADPGQVLVVDASEPGSASEKGLAQLRSWAATPAAARAGLAER